MVHSKSSTTNRGFSSIEALIALVMMSMMIMPVFTLTLYIVNKMQQSHTTLEQLLIIDNFRNRARLTLQNQNEITEKNSLLGIMRYTRTALKELYPAENVFLETVEHSSKSYFSLTYDSPSV